MITSQEWPGDDWYDKFHREPHHENSVLDWRDRNRLEQMADAIDSLDEDTNIHTIASELRRIAGES